MSKIRPLQKAFALQQLYRAFKPKMKGSTPLSKDERMESGLTAAGLLLTGSRSRTLSKFGAILAGGALLHRTLSSHVPAYRRWINKWTGTGR